MSNAQEAVKTRHRDFAYFPVLALVVLFLWGSSQTLPVVIAINLLALIGILSSAFPCCPSCGRISPSPGRTLRFAYS